jgi:hypothetical protein
MLILHELSELERAVLLLLLLIYSALLRTRANTFGVPFRSKLVIFITFRYNTVVICCNSQNKIEPHKNKSNRTKINRTRTKIIRTRTKINRKETHKNKSKGNGSEHKIERKRKSLTKCAGLVKNAHTDCGYFFYFIHNYIHSAHIYYVDSRQAYFCALFEII